MSLTRAFHSFFRFKEYIAVLDLLLKALVVSTSTSLFKTLMGIAIRESNHPHMEQIQRAMSSFALKLPLAKFLEITTYCFEYDVTMDPMIFILMDCIGRETDYSFT